MVGLPTEEALPGKEAWRAEENAGGGSGTREEIRAHLNPRLPRGSTALGKSTKRPRGACRMDNRRIPVLIKAEMMMETEASDPRQQVQVLEVAKNRQTGCY